MLKLLSYPLSLLTYFGFLFFICLFHPIQWICLNIFGYQAHKRSVDVLNFFLVQTLLFIFSNYSIKNRDLIPKGKPLIFVSNHQSTYDIVGFIWFFRQFHMKFVSKIELGSGIPSISYNLKHGGSVLIDRKDPKQALPALRKMAEYVQLHHRSVVIFPEGTRTKDGRPKEFAISGLKILCKYAPDAYIVPVTINNSWKVFRYGKFPLGLGNKISFTVHPPMSVAETDFNTLFEKTQKLIVDSII